MITRCQISFSIRGSGFNPAEHDLPWTETYQDPADPEHWGTGSMYYDLASLGEQEIAIRSLHEIFLPHLRALRRSGASVVDLFITWTYEDQCAGGFSEDELRWIAELGCSLAIDCVQVNAPWTLKTLDL